MDLNNAELQERLAPRSIRYIPQVESTNDIALVWLSEGAPQGSAVIADEQTHGRGRLGRIWHTTSDTALIVSVILRPRADHLHQITMLGALAICELVEYLGAVEVGIKWPNDVLLRGKKVSGVLPEAVWSGTQLSGVVLGMGVNVRVDFMGTELEDRAVSIETVLGRSLNRADLLQILLERVDFWAAQLGSASLFTAWENRLLTLGQRVRVQASDGERLGLAQSVDPEGALFLKTDDGAVHRILAGDIALGNVS